MTGQATRGSCSGTLVFVGRPLRRRRRRRRQAFVRLQREVLQAVSTGGGHF